MVSYKNGHINKFDGGTIFIELEDGDIGLVAGATLKGVVNVNQTKPFPCTEL